MRLLFKVLLTFCIRETSPAEPSIATRALDMRTFSVFHQLKILPAFWIWAWFSAIFEKKLIEYFFSS